MKVIIVSLIRVNIPLLSSITASGKTFLTGVMPKREDVAFSLNPFRDFRGRRIPSIFPDNFTWMLRAYISLGNISGLPKFKRGKCFPAGFLRHFSVFFPFSLKKLKKKERKSNPRDYPGKANKERVMFKFVIRFRVRKYENFEYIFSTKWNERRPRKKNVLNTDHSH
ncbi:uncharacterized protein NDAI_0B04080 [Naumovozyma dairenensis CBS 421]|uniref:Uncharacterized protein n=1 Tax=Naumovozyma dairenensis (strain ATCC 10597 / BCRC 20456 / CBS 421 / NBRC 0211 / NRRL Y-12639) TaxID=1071378 RepID=G0W6N1_NAUDC|nr:hypothetical protein NDAI_0B04080 [Naumovozyma dairenensis CBS 421]CCD23442.1 hypothetical protein NDAI_0B04080 [Naumovozyma dairenensis CBS 421]